MAPCVVARLAKKSAGIRSLLWFIIVVYSPLSNRWMTRARDHISLSGNHFEKRKIKRKRSKRKKERWKKYNEMRRQKNTAFSKVFTALWRDLDLNSRVHFALRTAWISLKSLCVLNIHPWFHAKYSINVSYPFLPYIIIYLYIYMYV